MNNKRGFALADLVVVSGVLWLVAAASVAPILAGGRLANERAAVVSLKTISTAEADFRENDRDGNRVMDFWTADVYGLFGMIPLTGRNITPPADAPDATRCLLLIDRPLAASDGRTDQALYGNAEFKSSIESGRPKRGYIVRALHNEDHGSGATTLLYDTDGARQFYGACHDNDRFGFITFPVSLTFGRSAFIINEDFTIWKYPLPAGYKATFTGASDAAKDSISTTGGKGLAPEFTLTAASGQGTFPAEPAHLGCSRDKTPPAVEWEAVLKGAPLTLSECLDKGLAEATGGVVILAEIESDAGKTVGAMDISKGKEIIAACLDLKDGKLIEKETTTDDRTAFIKSFKVTAKRGIELAIEKSPGRAVSVELDMHQDRPIIVVRIWSKGNLATIVIDGDTGAIITVEDHSKH